MLAGIIEDNKLLKDTLVEWLTGASSGGALNVAVSIASLTALSTDQGLFSSFGRFSAVTDRP